MNLCAQDMPGGVGVEGEERRVDADAFESAIVRVERAVAGSCAQHTEWPAQVAAGITAAVDFLGANPSAARALTIDSRSAVAEDSDYLAMIARFAGLLGDGAPHSERLPASNDRSVVTVIAAI